MKQLMEETKELFNVNGLEINKKKSVINTEACKQDATFLECIQIYKYLGITETGCISISEEIFIKVRNEIINRTKRPCEINLNSKNLFKMISEYTIVIN